MNTQILMNNIEKSFDFKLIYICKLCNNEMYDSDHYEKHDNTINNVAQTIFLSSNKMNVCKKCLNKFIKYKNLKNIFKREIKCF